MDRPYPKLTVTEKAERALRAGHPWVYGDEIVSSAPCRDGEIADVYSRKGRWLGAGFYNAVSKIRVRIVSRNSNDRFDEAFWDRKLRWAVDYRRTVMGEDFSACRLIFGDADGFPGLTADLFGDVLVTEVLSLGTDRIRPLLYGHLRSILAEYGVSLRAICERNDSPLREKEGLERACGLWDAPGLLTGDRCKAVIRENGLELLVDCLGGQKTGYFLDQKYNRRAAARIAPGRRVLDCFTHTGAFGLNCALAGAESVVSVDVSADALDQAKKNAALTGVSDRVTYLQSDVFDLLTKLAEEKRGAYDYIILDPPAFTKSSATVKAAIRGYKEINLKAMRILPRGGYLATCSCSHFMTDEKFRAMMADAAKDAQVTLRQIEARQQGPDHPILWNVPETDYLKFYLFQIV